MIDLTLDIMLLLIKLMVWAIILGAMAIAVWCGWDLYRICRQANRIGNDWRKKP